MKIELFLLVEAAEISRKGEEEEHWKVEGHSRSL